VWIQLRHLAGAVSRIPAAEIESLVIRSVRDHLNQSAEIEDAVLINTQVARIEVKSDQLAIELTNAKGNASKRSRTESLPTTVSVAGKRDFQHGEKCANTSPKPPISGLRDQTVVQKARQSGAFATTYRNSPQTVNCVVGPGDIAPAALSMACVSNIARGCFEPQRLLGALSKRSGWCHHNASSQPARELPQNLSHASVTAPQGSDNAGRLMLIHKASSTVLLGAG